MLYLTGVPLQRNLTGKIDRIGITTNHGGFELSVQLIAVFAQTPLYTNIMIYALHWNVKPMMVSWGGTIDESISRACFGNAL